MKRQYAVSLEVSRGLYLHYFITSTRERVIREVTKATIHSTF